MKRLINGTASRNNVAPIEYPWARQAFTDMRANYWVPGEINMAEDRRQYHLHLPENFKHTYRTVFSTLTTSDVLVMRNTVSAIASIITAPEVENVIAIHGFQEANHNDTYLLMTENLGLDEKDIYTLYERVPEIRQKFELAARYTDLIVSPDIRDKLKGLVFYYLGFEGVWFLNGFSPIFAMARSHNYMLASTDQLVYIARDEGGHANYGIDLIQGIMQEEGVKLSQSEVAAIARDVIAAENTYARYAVLPWAGCNANMHVGNAKYQMDYWLQKLGYEKVFGVACQFPWLAELLELKKEKAFFERRPTEYQVGAALDFGDNTSLDDLWGKD